MERLQLSLALADKEAQAFDKEAQALHKEAESIRIKMIMLETKGDSSESPQTPPTPTLPVSPKPVPNGRRKSLILINKCAVRGFNDGWCKGCAVENADSLGKRTFSQCPVENPGATGRCLKHEKAFMKYGFARDGEFSADNTEITATFWGTPEEYGSVCITHKIWVERNIRSLPCV
jgi:hypothetical protein